MVSTTLLLTVLSAVVLGIVSGYAVIRGILVAFARQRRADGATAPALIPNTEVPAGQA